MKKYNKSLLHLSIIFLLIILLNAVLFCLLYSQSDVLDENIDETPQTHVELYNININDGDNLTKIFQAVGLSEKNVLEISSLGEQVKELNNLKPKQIMSLSVDNEKNKCTKLVLWLSNEDKLEIAWQDDHYEAKKRKQNLTSALNYSKIIVKKSLLEDALAAGISKSLVYQLTEALGWEIDFIKDLRAGDEFHLIYTQAYLPGKGFVNDDLKEVTYVNKSAKLRADKFKNSSGLTAFYMPDGRRLSRDFLSFPLKYSRISSPFSTSRKHPLLGITRPHHGVDLAAKYGSPVWSTGQGKVSFVGTKSGYGKTIVIQHNYKYKTLYAHLSKFAKDLKKGSRVTQGQIIGYVGTSGIATGPHLHYEFRISNKPVNPLTIKIPRSPSLAKKDMDSFKETLEKYDTVREQIQQARE
ncbi:MAG: peptidoglycan DD-metalloendopeptidase family protein [Pseudomonadota bacterium]|nr:peptidoglycan DD-metalloendopeptidase family protein [Pseudomonadota bacterium]